MASQKVPNCGLKAAGYSINPHPSVLCDGCAVGAFETIGASSVRRGDLLVMLADPKDASAGFCVAAAQDVGVVKAEGLYNPAVESGYIITDGLVTPV